MWSDGSSPRATRASSRRRSPGPRPSTSPHVGHAPAGCVAGGESGICGWASVWGSEHRAAALSPTALPWVHSPDHAPFPVVVPGRVGMGCPLLPAVPPPAAGWPWPSAQCAGPDAEREPMHVESGGTAGGRTAVGSTMTGSNQWRLGQRGGCVGPRRLLQEGHGENGTCLAGCRQRTHTRTELRSGRLAGTYHI